jgi:hypothetical protein
LDEGSYAIGVENPDGSIETYVATVENDGEKLRLVLRAASGRVVVDGHASRGVITLGRVAVGPVPWAEDLPVALRHEDAVDAKQARLAEETKAVLRALR